MVAPATAATIDVSETLHLIESILPLASIQGKDILDAGCGVGEYSAAFVSAGAHRVIGFDISTDSLQRALGQSRTAQFAQASLTDMPFPDASFDVIWSWGVLHYVHDAQPALREISHPQQRLVQTVDFEFNDPFHFHAIVHFGLSCSLLGLATFSLPQVSPPDFANALLRWQGK